MEAFHNLVGNISDIVWGPPLLILLVGTGIYLTIRLSFLQFSALPYALQLAFSKKHQDQKSKGDITHYQALTTALAATIGTGNIAGVATAVVLGGPGAVFWMWITAIFGMATKYAEGILAVKYRVEGADGQMSGGPMYYIERGLGWKWLAVIFAVFGAVAAFGIGNMVQSNSVASAATMFNIPAWVTGLVLAGFSALVILGGIKSIGRVTALFVPIMALFYVIGGLVIIIGNLSLLPAAVGLIFTEAFTGSAALGGAVGAAIRYGVARGVFSNEAGLGSAPIAAAAAKTDYPGRQALVSMTQVFIDTIIVCSITGIILVMGGMYIEGDVTGAALTTATFASFLGTAGAWIVTIGLIFFASSTILGWSYYGEKCFSYLFGDKAIKFYRIAFVGAVFIGAVIKLELVWDIADVMNGLMAVPNLIGLLALSGVVVAETNIFLKKAREEKQAARESAR